ncbi:MAG: glycosyl hydrolase family 65 protein [Candidatus Zapsychrus exili]|nr:glycosyl hydrolase family 65 protein [Candidatus Zapsychrus exili]
MNTWKLTYNKFNPEEESLREALCTLGNGYFGTRGAASESQAGKLHYPGTYIAGVYNTLPTDVSGRTIYNEDFVNCPNWLFLNYRVDGGSWFDRSKTKILTWKVELNTRKGMLSRRIRWQDEKGRTTLIEEHRIVSMAQPHNGALVCTITPENYSGNVSIKSGIDGSVINAGVERYKQLNSKHLEPVSHGKFGEDGIFLQTRTNQTEIKITEALRTLVYKGRDRIKPEMKVTVTHGRQKIIQEFNIAVKKGEKYTIEKLVSIYTSRDHGVADDCDMAQESVNQIDNFDNLYKPHRAKWKALWKKFDIIIEGDAFTQMVLRLHAFHLLQVASTYNEDIDAGMPARGLHGEAYRGHIFWDELYVFPFYNLHAPEITRALLMYRYRRLGAAKDYAKQNEYRGAMFPWQSASAGDETTQTIHLNPMSGTWGDDYSCLQRHVSIAIAYNAWTYYYTTGDRGFLDRYGAEMILEIAHFWSSVATFNSKTKRYEIDGVMGPDEYHEKLPGDKKGGLKNNAYTNVMATWVIEKALYILEKMITDEDRDALLLKVGVSEEELSRWNDIIHKMTVVMNKKGIIHQFQGYMDLEELDWDDYTEKYENIRRMDRILKAEGLSPDDYKLAKQADVLMLFYTLNIKELKEIFKRLGYKFNIEIMRNNFDYYFKRTSHGSTLSLVVHAYVSELLGYKDKSQEYLLGALESDVYDTQGGTTQEGIHTGVMGSTLDLVLRIYGGLSISEDRICINPQLQEHWKSMKFSVRYKRIWFHVKVFKGKVDVLAEVPRGVSLSPSKEIPIEIKNKSYTLIAGKTTTVSL